MFGFGDLTISSIGCAENQPGLASAGTLEAHQRTVQKHHSNHRSLRVAVYNAHSLIFIPREKEHDGQRSQ